MAAEGSAAEGLPARQGRRFRCWTHQEEPERFGAGGVHQEAQKEVEAAVAGTGRMEQKLCRSRSLRPLLKAWLHERTPRLVEAAPVTEHRSGLPWELSGWPWETLLDEP